MCGLASRWPINRSVKKACSSGASGSWQGLDDRVQPVGGECEQFGDRRSGTSRWTSGRVAQVGRQQRQRLFDVQAPPIPADQGVHREAVAQVMQPRPAMLP